MTTTIAPSATASPSSSDRDLFAIVHLGSHDANRAPGDRVGVHIDGSRALCEPVG